MLVLHTFGPAFGLPDPSPFVTKADVLLKMSGLPYQSRISNLFGAPKGKLPYVEIDGRKLGDSTFLRFHLEQVHGVDFDPGLNAEQRGLAWAVEKMLEDQLYWAIVDARWMDDRNFDKGPRHFFDTVPALFRPLVVGKVRKDVRRTLHGQGFGRHTREEIVQLGNRSLDALSAVLGDKPYLFGDQACGADATAFAFVLAALCPYFSTPIRDHAERLPNLVAYAARLRARFYPEP